MKLETNDTHSKLRRTYMRLAQLMDAPSSNGTLEIGWMDCVCSARRACYVFINAYISTRHA